MEYLIYTLYMYIVPALFQVIKQVMQWRCRNQHREDNVSDLSALRFHLEAASKNSYPLSIHSYVSALKYTDQPPLPMYKPCTSAARSLAGWESYCKGILEVRLWFRGAPFLVALAEGKRAALAAV